MLASLQRVHRVLAMAVRPGANADGVDVVRIEDRLGVGLDPRDAEFVGDAATTLLGAVADGNQLHTINRLEARNMPQRGISTCTDEANSQGLARHKLAPSLSESRSRCCPDDT